MAFNKYLPNGMKWNWISVGDPPAPCTFEEDSVFLALTACPAQHSFAMGSAARERWKAFGQDADLVNSHVSPSAIYQNPLQRGRWPIKALPLPFVSGPVRDSSKLSTMIGPCWDSAVALWFVAAMRALLGSGKGSWVHSQFGGSSWAQLASSVGQK